MKYKSMKITYVKFYYEDCFFSVLNKKIILPNFLPPKLEHWGSKYCIVIMNNTWIIAIKVQVSKSFEFYFWFYLWFYHSHKKQKDSLDIQKILLSRWLHSKLISTLKFLGNWKIMFWVISQEQHNIKTHEFTETNSYFYSFTYEKNIFSG